MNQAQIDNMFTYHAPSGTQPTRYSMIREAAKSFASLINASCPESREKSLAITRLQESVQMANASIAINENPVDVGEGKPADSGPTAQNAQQAPPSSTT